MVKEKPGKGNLLSASRKHWPTLDQEPRLGGKLCLFYDFASGETFKAPREDDFIWLLRKVLKLQ